MTPIRGLNAPRWWAPRIRRRAIVAGAVLVVAATLLPFVAAAQSSAALYSRDSDKDIAVADESAFMGLWSDDTTVWLASATSKQIHAYTLSDGSRDAGKDISVENGASVEGIWSDDTTMWVLRNGRYATGGARPGGAAIEAYTLSNGSRESAKDISLGAENLSPHGLWSNGTTIWTSNLERDKVYAYTLSNGSRDEAKDIRLTASNSHAAGLWSDGTTVWVSDYMDAKLYGYTLADGSRDVSKDFSVAIDGSGYWIDGSPRGLWSNDTTMWVAEPTTRKLYAFHMTGSSIGGV